MKNKNMFIVSPETSIIEIMEKINSNLNGIVYVCKDEKLLGAVTDGDIRRYILKNRTIMGCSEDVMNSAPQYIYIGDECDVYEVMRNNHIKSIPIVDKERCIHDICFLNENKVKKTALNIPVVIMAGGKGTRLYPYTQILPKPLIPINDKTITELIMENFEEYGCTSFTMIVNYKKEFIKAYFHENEIQRDVKFVDENEFMGTAGGLKLLEGTIRETFFMSNCDILIEEDYAEMLKYHRQHKNIITIVCALKKQIFPYGTIETTEDGSIIALKEKPTFEFLTNTGLYIIEPEFLDLIPENTYIHITDVIEACIAKKLNVGVYPVRDEAWMDMGEFEEMRRMEEKLNVK